MCLYLQRLQRLRHRLHLREWKLPQVEWRHVHDRWRMRKWQLREQWKRDEQGVLRGFLPEFSALRDQGPVPGRWVRVPDLPRCLCGSVLLPGWSFESVRRDVYWNRLRTNHHVLQWLYLLRRGVREHLFGREHWVCHRLHLQGHNLSEVRRPALRRARRVRSWHVHRRRRGYDLLRDSLPGCCLREQSPLRGQWLRLPDPCRGDLQQLFDRRAQYAVWNMQRIGRLHHHHPGYFLQRVSLRGRCVQDKLCVQQRLRRIQLLHMQRRELRATA